MDATAPTDPIPVKIERLTLVDLESEVEHLGKLMCMPRYGLSAIGSALDAAGYSVRILADAFGKVTIDEILAGKPDVVLWNGIKATVPRVRAMVAAIRARAPQLRMVVGGEDVTLDPAAGSEFADVIILGEGDETVVRLLKAMAEGVNLASIPGIVFRRDGLLVKTEPAPRVKAIRYQLNPKLYRGLAEAGRSFLARHLDLWQGRLLSFPIQTSRGCDRACSFCTWPVLFGGRGYVERDVEDVLGDIECLGAHANIRDFTVVDNLFGFRREYAHTLAEGLISRFGTAQRRPELTVLMRADQFGAGGYEVADITLLHRAGLRHVILGLESINAETLRRLRKGTSVSQYVRAIEILRQGGVRVGGSFAIGSGEETRDDLRRIVEFARQTGLYRLHLYAYCLLPGAPAGKMDGHLRIRGVDDRFVAGHAATIFPRRMLPSELQEAALAEMNRFYRWFSQEGAFYKRQIRRIRASLKPHTAFLHQLESELIAKGIYRRQDNHWVLDEERLGMDSIA